MSSRYESLLLLGSGGMASVHVGRLRGVDGFSRLVALKRAHAHIKEDLSLANAMRLEARIASYLHHANVVSVRDVEEDAGDLVLVLDYVEGCTLSTLLGRMQGSHPRAIVSVILDVAAGLHAAHIATDGTGSPLGLVHRDVSPSNILLGTDGVARVSDFGIAKAQFANRERTETGILKGKASYMAPEYVLHQRADAASDLFSLGIVAWEALTGVRLFRGATEIDTLNRVIAATTRPMAEHDPRLAPLDAVVLRALSRLPEDRQASVDVFAVELAAVARDHDLLGSHHEVSALVESVAAGELEIRRRELAKTAPSFIGTVPALTASERGRDADATATLTASERGRDADATLTLSADAPTSVRFPTAAPSPGPPLALVAFRRNHVPGATTREKVGMVAALGLLVLALVGLCLKMRDDEGDARAAPVVPSGSAPPLASESASASASAASPPNESVPAPAETVIEENTSSRGADVAVDATVPREVSRPAHRRVYPATPPALMPRKAPPNPYGK